MHSVIQKREIAKRLQAKVNAMQGLGHLPKGSGKSDFYPLSDAFPNKIFPEGAIHEFISHQPEDAACTSGFMMALAGKMSQQNRLCVWIGNERKLFPAAIKTFGLRPDRIIFVKIQKKEHALWAVEEALKCEALTAVIAEIRTLGFTESRRLQLAAERSGVTGFIHRYRPWEGNSAACTARWRITPAVSLTIEDLPGMGYSNWNVDLLKVRNGKPASWQLAWRENRFTTMEETSRTIPIFGQRHAG